MSDTNFESVNSETLRRRFKLLVRLGSGGMAVVHLAMAASAAGAQKLVVLKSIRPDLAENKRVLDMFLDEARLAVRLTHPNVIQTHDVISLGRRPIIVMEYLEGQTFSRCVEEGMELSMRLNVLKEMLAGLHYMHELAGLDGERLGLVHRDISPQNCIVSYDGYAKILDFGIAKAKGATIHDSGGAAQGKVRYMAPEQMAEGESVDRRADLYSVGVMMWEALTGQRAWQEETDVQVMAAVFKQGLPPPSQIKSGVDPDLERICRKAIAPLAERYENAEQMQTDIEQAMARLNFTVDPRQVGRWVSTTFATLRTKMKEIVARQIQAQDATIVEIASPNDAHALSNIDFRVSTHSSPFSSAPSPTTAAPKSAAWTMQFVLGALLLAALSAGGVLVWRAGRPTAPTPAQTASPPTSLSATTSTAMSSASAVSMASASASKERLVEVHVVVQPAFAQLTLDDQSVPNPYSKWMPMGGAPHKIHAEAAGFVPKTIDSADLTDVPITIVLDPIRGVGPVPVLSATRTTQKPANCANPFYRDAEGIQHIKPECMGN